MSHVTTLLVNNKQQRQRTCVPEATNARHCSSWAQRGCVTSGIPAESRLYVSAAQ